MQFVYDNQIYNVEIIKKNNKNLYIRVDSNLNIKITCPYLYTKKMINKIINDNEKSIVNMIKKQKERNIKEINENLLGKSINIIYKDVRKPLFEDNNLYIKDDLMKDKWYKIKAFEIFKVNLDRIYNLFEEKIPYPKLKIRKMKTRWGVCNRKDNSITLNLELIKMNEKYLNYVIVHELSHFIHFDHSKLFWNKVEKYCPNYKKIRKELRK